MPRLTLCLFGGFQVETTAGRPLTLNSAKAQALLAYLALPAGRSRSRDELAGLLWGETGDRQAQDSLRHALAALRKTLAAVRVDALTIESGAVALDADAVTVDVTAFELLVAQGTPAALSEALALYRGDLLPGLRIAEPAFEAWLARERERLRARALTAFETLAAHQAADAAAAVETTARLLALDPARETAHRALMRLYAGAGREAEALRQYQLCVAALQRELGVQPALETRELYQEILCRQREPARRAAPATDTRHAPEPAGHGTPLVGRQSELAGLTTALEAARAGRGRLTAVMGEAGIGKSRLVAALADEAHAQGAEVYVGRCYDTEQILPFRPWVDALGPLLAGALEAGDTRAVFEAVAGVLVTTTAERPALLILEDLHWADDMSVRLLSFIARRLERLPLLVVTTIRAEEVADTPVLERLMSSLTREERVERLTLRPLSRGDTVTLVRALAAPDDAQVKTLGEQVWTLSHGHPFIAVEAVRAAQQGARLPSERGVPDRIRDLIAARLACLGERARQLTALAAIIGRPFEFALLQQAAGLGEADAAVAVEELARRGVLQAVDDHLDLAHERLRDVAHAGILAPIRKALHAAVARAMETLYADDLAPHLAALALHHRESEAWARAVECFRGVGEQAARRAAHREAAACFEEALSAHARLSEGPEPLLERLGLEIALRHSLSPLGDVPRLGECLDRAERIATRLGDRRHLAWIASYQSDYAALTLDHGQATEAARLALALGEELGDERLVLEARNRLLFTSMDLGDLRSTAAAARQLLGSLATGAITEGTETVMARLYLAGALAELGDCHEARAAAADGLRVAIGLGNDYTATAARYTIGIVRLLQGDVLTAVPELEAALALGRTREFGYFLPFLKSGLGIAYVVGGRVEEALPLLEQAVAEADRGRITLWRALHLVRLGEGLLAAGRHDDARAQGEHALAISNERNEGRLRGWALRLMGDIAADRGDAVGLDFYQQALGVARERGMRALEAYCLLGLGRLFHRLGKRDPARDALTAAAARFDTMSMPAFAAEARKRLGD